MTLRSFALLPCLVFAACVSTIDAEGPQNNFTVVLQFEGNGRMALAVADPVGRLGEHMCRIEADAFGSEAICTVNWREPGDPGVLVFDIIASDNSRRCETHLRTGTPPTNVRVTLPDGRELHISAPMATSLGGRCGYVVNTANLL